MNVLPHIHDGLAVNSVQWSRNLNYLLTAGRDGRARLWDMRKGPNSSGAIGHTGRAGLGSYGVEPLYTIAANVYRSGGHSVEDGVNSRIKVIVG